MIPAMNVATTSHAVSTYSLLTMLSSYFCSVHNNHRQREKPVPKTN